MARMSSSISVPANSTVANVVAGLLHEFVARPSAMRVGASSAATGVNGTALVSGPSGQKILMNDQLVPFTNRYPQIPEDVVVQGTVPPGRVVLTFRNTTAGAIVVNWFVDVVPG